MVVLDDGDHYLQRPTDLEVITEKQTNKQNEGIILSSVQVKHIYTQITHDYLSYRFIGASWAITGIVGPSTVSLVFP